MSNRINFGLRALAGITALIVLGLGLNFLISQLRDQAIAASENTAPDNNMPVSTKPEDRLFAFTKVENGNYEIYTINADGSDLTNITNNPADDRNPIWSPDGKHVVFESNRSGPTQIYSMDPDGSNVVQLTIDSTDHFLPLNVNGDSNPWSPDGSKILFLHRDSPEYNPPNVIWTLRSGTINGKNWVSIATGRISGSGISWSPDGRYVGYILNDSTDPTISPPDSIFIVDADGKNPREIKKLIPQDEHAYTYKWSSDGTSITFITNKSHSLDGAVYEFNPTTNTLLQMATFTSRVLDWQKDVSFTILDGKPETTFVWQRSDGTSNTLDWGSECWQLTFRRSANGNFAVSAYCPDNKSALYWANSDGSIIKKLFTPSADDTITGVGDISWSRDDQYIAFAFQTPEKTTMYILDVQAALEDPSTMPQEVVIGEGEQYIIPSWQPTH